MWNDDWRVEAVPTWRLAMVRKSMSATQTRVLMVVVDVPRVHCSQSPQSPQDDLFSLAFVLPSHDSAASGLSIGPPPTLPSAVRRKT